MNELKKESLDRERLFQWLRSSSESLVTARSSLIKLEKMPEVNYIYGLSGKRDMDSAFHFCGVYLRVADALRLADWPLAAKDISLTAEECEEEKALVARLSVQVNSKIEELIGNDRSQLSVETVTDMSLKRNLDYYLEYGAREDAVRQFFAGNEPDGQFRSDYQAKSGQEDKLLAYLTAPEELISAEAKAYIESHQQEILSEFLKNDALLAAYNQLEADVDNPIHRMRSITQAVEGSGAKSVNVTIQKEGAVLTFKMSAAAMTGYHPDYSTWDIPAQDRRKFQELFGKHADFTAEDVTQITYGRSVIYEAALEQEQTEAIGPVMGGMAL